MTSLNYVLEFFSGREMYYKAYLALCEAKDNDINVSFTLMNPTSYGGTLHAYIGDNLIQVTKKKIRHKEYQWVLKGTSRSV